jgi:hypothetical protein
MGVTRRREAYRTCNPLRSHPSAFEDRAFIGWRSFAADLTRESWSKQHLSERKRHVAKDRKVQKRDIAQTRYYRANVSSGYFAAGMENADD